MTNTDMIDDYLRAFAASVRGRHDQQDLIDEVGDHLRAAADHFERAGEDPYAAQTLALARFGEPRIVASLISSVPSSGNGVTRLLALSTRGLAAVTSVLWLVAGAALVYGLTDVYGWTQAGYAASSPFGALACAATTLMLVAAHIRSTGRFGREYASIPVFGALATLVAAALFWVVALWVGFLAVAALVTLSGIVAARADRFVRVLRVAIIAVTVGAAVQTIASMSWTDQTVLDLVVFAAVVSTFIALSILVLVRFVLPRTPARLTLG